MRTWILWILISTRHYFFLFLKFVYLVLFRNTCCDEWIAEKWPPINRGLLAHSQIIARDPIESLWAICLSDGCSCYLFLHDTGSTCKLRVYFQFVLWWRILEAKSTKRGIFGSQTCGDSTETQYVSLLWRSKLPTLRHVPRASISLK